MKKIIILSCNGGGGHTSVAQALQEYLKTDYTVEIANIFEDILAPLDLSQPFTRRQVTGEKIYNYWMARKWYRVINGYMRLGIAYYGTLSFLVDYYFSEFFKKEKPDLIISVTPVVNNTILKVAKRFNIPFLLVPTDLDISTFLNGIKKPSYEKFKVALAFENQGMEQQISKARMAEQALDTTGFIIRPDFFEQKDIPTLKKLYDIPSNKPVILVLLGAVGLQTQPAVAQQLTKLDFSAHFIFCVGRQEELHTTIRQLAWPEHLSLTTIGFTKHISDLMAVSDLLITKSGTVSVSEAIYMNLPMILDSTSSLLNWEKHNHNFVATNNFGISIKNLNDLPNLVKKIMHDSEKLTEYKLSMLQYKKNHGGTRVRHLIKQMLEV